MYQDTDGRLYERCDRCGMRAEVDDREDAKGWGINHWAIYHEGSD